MIIFFYDVILLAVGMCVCGYLFLYWHGCLHCRETLMFSTSMICVCNHDMLDLNKHKLFGRIHMQHISRDVQAWAACIIVLLGFPALGVSWLGSHMPREGRCVSPPKQHPVWMCRLGVLSKKNIAYTGALLVWNKHLNIYTIGSVRSHFGSRFRAFTFSSRRELNLLN